MNDKDIHNHKHVVNRNVLHNSQINDDNNYFCFDNESFFRNDEVEHIEIKYWNVSRLSIRYLRIVSRWSNELKKRFWAIQNSKRNLL
jgi:hypothetical protein